MRIQEQIRALDPGSAIADKIVMNYATDAFLRSTHTKALIAALASEWKALAGTTFKQY